MSSRKNEEDVWVPYSKREAWKDIRPGPQIDGDNILRIYYTDKFRDVFSYFWKMFSLKEISQRALELTGDAAKLNPSNYAVWHYRRLLIQQLGGCDLESEKEFCRNIMEGCPKCYQVWEHRKKLVEMSEDPSKERRVTEIILAKDPKNYHAWQHRLWVVSTYKLFDGEMDYTSRLLEDDIFNNSAWNYRIAFLDITEKGNLCEKTLQKELPFALDAIGLSPNNESSWSYLSALLDKSCKEYYPQASERVLGFLSKSYEDKITNVFMLESWLDALELCLKRGDPSGPREPALKKILEITGLLSREFDKDKAKFWTSYGERLTNEYAVKRDR